MSPTIRSRNSRRSRVNSTAWMIVVSPSLPVKTPAEFVAYTKAHPGTINFAATQGTAAILVAERFKQLSGADLFDHPLQGRRGRTARFPWRAHPDAEPDAVDLDPAHPRRQDAPAPVTSPTRIAQLPDVPTAREVGLPDLTLEFWAGVLAPAGTPPEIVGKLNAAINDTLRSPEMKEAMSKLGMEAKIGSPQDFATFIAEETPRWTAIVKATGVKQ